MNEVIFKASEIKIYDEVEKQLTDLEKWNSTAVFDYSDPKGNKEARSHIYKLRKTKTAVDNARKEAGKDALEYKRKVDARGKEIIEKVEKMIAVHQEPLDEIEDREKARLASHEETMAKIRSYTDPVHLDMSSTMINNYIHELEELEPTEAMEEFMGYATKLYKESRAFLISAHEKAAAREKEKAELEKLRAEKEARERKEREEKIAAEAAERAKIESEEAARRQQEGSDRREAEAKAALEAAEAARVEAEKKAIEDARLEEERRVQAVKDAEERVKKESEEKAAAEKAEAEKREANKRHAAKIHNQAMRALIENGLTEEAARSAVEAIAKRLIPNVSMIY